MAPRLMRYHVELFRWHCRELFRFDEALSDAELRYLERCFALPEGYSEVTEGGYDGLSYYTYSHRVDGTRVNSTRIAYGTVKHPHEAYPAAKRVLDERGVDVARCTRGAPGLLFYGLGWDFEARHFKLYFRTLDVDGLAPLFGELFAGAPEQRSTEGLLSFTFVDDEIAEEKVYFLPERARASHVLMSTSARGAVPQHDEAARDEWLSRINDTGRALVERYAAIDEPLDTIQWDDRDHFTLYFP